MHSATLALSGHENLMTISEVAAFLAVSRMTVYRMVNRRLITAYRLARGLRFSRTQILSELTRGANPRYVRSQD